MADVSTLSDHEMVHEMRQGNRRALREFFIRFEPSLTDYAARMGVPRELREELVTEFLDDIALKLLDPSALVPESVVKYVVTSFRHGILNRIRSDERRRAAHAAAVGEALPGENATVVSACSEDTLRASSGPDVDEGHLSPARKRLAEALDATLTEDERLLLSWLSRWVSATEIATRLGITREAAKARIRRLRRRLYHAAVQHVLATEDRQELLHFLRGVDGLDAADRAALSDGGPQPPKPPRPPEAA